MSSLKDAAAKLVRNVKQYHKEEELVFRPGNRTTLQWWQCMMPHSTTFRVTRVKRGIGWAFQHQR